MIFFIFTHDLTFQGLFVSLTCFDAIPQKQAHEEESRIQIQQLEIPGQPSKDYRIFLPICSPHVDTSWLRLGTVVDALVCLG
jgi:hypothetical protein